MAHAPNPVTSVAAAAAATPTTTATATARYRLVARAQTPSNPGWTLISAPSAVTTPTTQGRSIHRHAAANPRKRSGSTWPSFTA